MAHPLEDLRAASRGELAARVWLSDKYPGATMQYVFTRLGVELGDEDHGLPAGFADTVRLYHSGTLTPEEAKERVNFIEQAMELAQR